SQALEYLKPRHDLGKRAVPVKRHVALSEQVVLRLGVEAEVQDMAEVPFQQRSQPPGEGDQLVLGQAPEAAQQEQTALDRDRGDPVGSEQQRIVLAAAPELQSVRGHRLLLMPV